MAGLPLSRPGSWGLLTWCFNWPYQGTGQPGRWLLKSCWRRRSHLGASSQGCDWNLHTKVGPQLTVECVPEGRGGQGAGVQEPGMFVSRMIASRQPEEGCVELLALEVEPGLRWGGPCGCDTRWQGMLWQECVGKGVTGRDTEPESWWEGSANLAPF